MADDCANNWGTTLCQLGKPERSKVGFRGLSETKFKRLVSHQLGGAFQVSKVTATGSEANMHAIMDLTGGETNALIIASGCYVAGDGALLQSWSSSMFAIDQGPSMITPPSKLDSRFAKRHTVALPYHIPGTMEATDLKEYEDSCMEYLHLRCLVAKMIGTPVRGMLMELILAANGTSLSDRALVMIAKLAEIHGFGIIVDEIMTGGRTGNMLLTQTQPESFIKAVTHITMGKWLEVGIVLCCKVQTDTIHKRLSNMPRRGASSGICMKEPTRIWHSVVSELENISERRREVLKKLNIKEEQAWGKGVLIFVPIKRKGKIEGTKNRLLPMIHGPKIDSIPKDNMFQSWSKELISAGIVAGVKEWAAYNWTENTQEEDLFLLAKAMINHSEGNASTNWFLTNPLKDKQHSIKSVAVLLRLVEAAGLIQKACISKKRIRTWKINESMFHLPWHQEKVGPAAKKKARIQEKI